MVLDSAVALTCSANLTQNSKEHATRITDRTCILELLEDFNSEWEASDGGVLEDLPGQTIENPAAAADDVRQRTASASVEGPSSTTHTAARGAPALENQQTS